MPGTHLTPPARETVVLLSDADDVATISTHQRRILTRLERNPLARKVADLTHGSSAGARFELPAWAITYRSKRRKGGVGNPEALKRVREGVNGPTRSDPTDTTKTGAPALSRGLDSTEANSATPTRGGLTLKNTFSALTDAVGRAG